MNGKLFENAKSYFLNRHPAAIVLMLCAIAIVFIGVVYTGYHTYSLFLKSSNDTGIVSHIIPIAAVVVFEGSLIMGMFCSLFWPMNGMQKTINMLFGLLIFGILTFNTLADNGAIDAEYTGLSKWLMVMAFIVAIAYWKYFIISDDVAKTNAEKYALMESVSIAEIQLEAEQRKSTIADKMNELTIARALNEQVYRAGMHTVNSDEVARMAKIAQMQQTRRAMRNLTGMITPDSYLDDIDTSLGSGSSKGHLVTSDTKTAFKSFTVPGPKNHSIRFKKSGKGVVLWFREGQKETYGLYVSMPEYNVIKDDGYPELAKLIIKRKREDKPELCKKIQKSLS